METGFRVPEQDRIGWSMSDTRADGTILGTYQPNEDVRSSKPMSPRSHEQSILQGGDFT